jgi:hypothetical protein
MLIKDLIAQGTLHKTIDLLEGMMEATNPKKRRDDVRIRAYLVGSYWRKRPRKLRLVTKQEAQGRAKLRREADRILKSA